MEREVVFVAIFPGCRQFTITDDRSKPVAKNLKRRFVWVTRFGKLMGVYMCVSRHVNMCEGKMFTNNLTKRYMFVYRSEHKGKGDVQPHLCVHMFMFRDRKDIEYAIFDSYYIFNISYIELSNYILNFFDMWPCPPKNPFSKLC